MVVVWIVIANVVALAATGLVVEMRSRDLQRQKFQTALREADRFCRKANWILVDATFKAGWLRGQGWISWRRRDGRIHSSPVTVDAAACTREVARLW